MDTMNFQFGWQWSALWLRLRTLRALSVFTLLTALMTVSSAFAIIYVKDLHRRLFINYQQQTAAQQREQVRWGKLLLEQSAWSTQSRIQRIAQNRLGMEVPAYHQIVMIAMNQPPKVAIVNEPSPKAETQLAENDTHLYGQLHHQGT